MALSDSPGGVAPRKHKLNKSNIEQAENEKMQERRNQGPLDRFPANVHKPGKLEKTVFNDDEMAAAIKAGWYADVRDVPQPKRARPDKIFKMTVAEATEFVDECRHDGAKLSELLGSEMSHANRPEVIALIEGAADALGTEPPSSAPVKKAKPGPKKK